MIKQKNRLLLTTAAVVAAILFNGFLSYFNNYLSLPLFMDSILTILIAALFGLWPATAVALLTNSFIELLNGFPGYYFPFTITNLLTALLTSLFVYKKYFETPNHVFWLILVLSFINSLTGAILVTYMFNGVTNHSIDNIVRGIIMTGQSVFSSTLTVRLVTNIVDKGLSVMITYIIYKNIQKKAGKQH
ncbi:MAG: hypothetical protein JEY91_03465 [Spirochaetaceae bacterium]|nr:hypothetical protein [Spirochaetaceae bacterium]